MANKIKLSPSGDVIKEETPVAKNTPLTVGFSGGQLSGTGGATTPANKDLKINTSGQVETVQPWERSGALAQKKIDAGKLEKTKSAMTPSSRPEGPQFQKTITPKITAPTIKSTAKTTQQVGKQATVWNPKTGEKKVINVGDAMPTGFSMWTGGTATGKEAQDAIKNKLPFGMTKDQMEAQNAEMKSSEDMAADVLDGDIMTEDEADTEIDTKEETTVESPTKEVDDILDGMGIDKLKVSDFSQDYVKLEEWKTNQLVAVDSKYEQRIIDQEKNNKKATAALQANMIKKGIPLDGISYMSATSGQEERNQEQINMLNREMAQEKAAINSGYIEKNMGLMQSEREEKFNVMTTNINNLYQGYGLATNIWNSFNSRSEAVRSAEQKADELTHEIEMDWANYTQEERFEKQEIVMQNATDGNYDIMNEDDIKMIMNLESKFGMQTGELLSPATSGYFSKFSKLAKEDAETQKLISDINKQETLLPLEIAKYEADIKKSTAAAQKSMQSNLGGNQASLTNAYLEELKVKLFGGEFQDGKFIAYKDESGNEMTSYLGSDMKLDTQRYNTAMNDFVAKVDPDLKNKNYYQDIFMNYIPPNAFLNPNDATASTLISEYTKRGDEFAIIVN